MFGILYEGHHHIQKNMEQVFRIHGPMKIADILFRKAILNPMHYYIITTLKEASLSYLSKVLCKMLNLEFESSSKYQKFKTFVKAESSLDHLNSLMSDVGKCNARAKLLIIISSSYNMN